MPKTPSPKSSAKISYAATGGVRSEADRTPSTTTPGSTAVGVDVTDDNTALDVTVTEASSPALDVHVSGEGEEMDVDIDGKSALRDVTADMGDEDDNLSLSTNTSLLFARERTRMLAAEAKTKKILSLTSQGNRISDEEWTKLSSSFMSQLESLKDETYDPSQVSSSYLKSYNEEGKRFYQNMKIEKQGPNAFVVRGVDLEQGSDYLISYSFSPEKGTIRTDIDGATDKSLMTAIEMYRHASETSKSSRVRITSCTDFETLEKTIAMLKSQGLTPTIDRSPLVQQILKDHIRESWVEKYGKEPTREEVREDIDRYLNDKFYMGINPAKMEAPKPAATPKPVAPPATAKPATAKPATAKPATAKPTTAKPNPMKRR